MKGLYFLDNKNLWKESKFILYKRKAFKIFNKQKDQDPYSTKRLLNLVIKPYEKKVLIQNSFSYRGHFYFRLRSQNFKNINDRGLKIYKCKNCGLKLSFI